MTHNPAGILEQGCAILDRVLRPHGFSREEIVAGKGSGGHFATTAYVNHDRKLEIHFRFSLGLVTYHLGLLSVGHDEYMKAVLGSKGGNKYPGFSNEPSDAFQDLAYDLENFAQSFLRGDSPEFSGYVTAAKKQSSLTGFARLANSES